MSFQYYKVPMGMYQKFIKLNHLSTYALERLVVGRLSRDEIHAFAKVEVPRTEIKAQAIEILKRRKRYATSKAA